MEIQRSWSLSKVQQSNRDAMGNIFLQSFKTNSKYCWIKVWFHNSKLEVNIEWHKEKDLILVAGGGEYSNLVALVSKN